MNTYETKHNKYLRKMGAECTVLLKKDGHFPLSETGDIAVYGSGARNTVKGGTGSGEVNSRFFVTVEQGLEDAGFRITSKAWLDAYNGVRSAAKQKFLVDLKAEAKAKHQNVMMMSMGRAMKESEYKLPLNGTGDTGIYVLARISGEGSDRVPEAGDILLSKTEIRDILACNKKYENFMLVINAGGVVDLTPVLAVKNILVLSQLGVETGHILADILLGKQSPSGKLTTTWSAWEDYPSIGDFGEKDDTCYKEGIYVGYRYFDSIGKKPLFPFGFGLTYSQFTIQVSDVHLEQDVVTVESTVKNVGEKAAKEVVQLYVSIPAGKLDEPYQVLAGFGKTRRLDAGEEETVKIAFSMKDIAPYDTESESYLLEAGDYILRIGNSSADTVAAGIVRVEETITTLRAKNVLGNPGFADDKIPKLAAAGKEKDIRVDEVSNTDEGAGNSDRARIPANLPTYILSPDVISTDTVDYTRKDVINSDIKKLSDDQLVKLNIGAFNSKGGVASIIGNAGFTVAGAAGQTSLEAKNFGVESLVMADGPAGLRLAKEYAVDKNGGIHALGGTMPESILELMPKPMGWLVDRMGYKLKKTDKVRRQYATALPIGTAIAQSFNTDFAEKCGKIVGFEMNHFGVHLWLAPALNIHRSIRCGRNFEYYSEDPFVSGMMAGYITKGVQSYAHCGTTIKHYAFNNQERNRTQNSSRLSERAAREIYLKGFGIAVKISQPKAVMTSYNLVNGTHVNEHRGLIEDVLRAEYGFQGIVMTDWVISHYKTEDNCKYPVAKAPNVCMAGGDLFMPGSKSDYKEVMEGLQNGTVKRQQLLVNASRVAAMAKELV
ncbi:MAG: glycoside hydrolase family 3 C-terminal domain-containing protein [Eubacterium sp.]|nr:glycoside hydrolase family 3 C-terminal domain-containing protein [Eubacterium sp.]